MGTSHQLAEHRSYSRIALTLLAALSLIATQFVGFPQQPAGANSHNGNFYFAGYLALSNGDRIVLGVEEPQIGQSQSEWFGPASNNVDLTPSTAGSDPRTRSSTSPVRRPSPAPASSWRTAPR